jgi:hypothetical protein
METLKSSEKSSIIKSAIRIITPGLIVGMLVTALVACTVTPKHVESSATSNDASTPAQYDQKNSGLLFLIKGEGAVLTQGGKEYYDALVVMYGNQIVPEVKVGDGCQPFRDQYGNDLWFLKNQYFVYFVQFSVWEKDHRPKKNIIDKILR